MKKLLERIGKSFVGILLSGLGITMLLIVIRAIPNGTLVYVNKVCGIAETTFDLAICILAIILGLAFMIWQFYSVVRENNG